MHEEEIARKIGDFRELGFPEVVRRDCPLHMAENTVATLVGARRAGKTYRALQAATDLVSSGKLESLEHVCALDFDNPVLSQMSATELSSIQRSFLKLTPGAGQKTPLVFVLDEIHKIKGWEEYVVDLSRNPNWLVIVTGSSSKLLRDEIATELRGKSLSSVVYPLSFREYLRFRAVDRQPVSTAEQAIAMRHFDSYIQSGSFPAISRAEPRVHEPLLREYFETMVLKDIIQRYEVSQPNACIAVLRHLLSNMSRPFTVKSLHSFAAGAGHHISRETLANYVRWAQDSWFLFSVPIFSSSTKELERNYRKLYCIDWALANANSLTWDGSRSQALENAVYIHLRREFPRVHYYLTRSKRQEVDFVAVDSRGKPVKAVQVCLDLRDEGTRGRELSALVSTAKYLGVEEALVVTYATSATIQQEGITVRVVPAWRWMLE